MTPDLLTDVCSTWLATGGGWRNSTGLSDVLSSWHGRWRSTGCFRWVIPLHDQRLSLEHRTFDCLHITCTIIGMTIVVIVRWVKEFFQMNLFCNAPGPKREDVIVTIIRIHLNLIEPTKWLLWGTYNESTHLLQTLSVYIGIQQTGHSKCLYNN